MKETTSETPRGLSFFVPRILLGLAALFWGATFVVVKEAIRSVDPVFFIGSRFFLAAVMLLAFSPGTVARNIRPLLGRGLVLGALLTFGFVTQTLGLQFTTASASGFITGLSIILVAVFAALLTGRRPRFLQAAGILSGTVGLLLLAMRAGHLAFSGGDLLTLACAVGFALHIVMTGVYAPHAEPLTLSFIQFATVAAAALLYSAFTGSFALHSAVAAWPAVVFTGVFASGLAFLFQTIAQRKVPSVEAAVILAAEPLFSALFAFLVLGETAGWRLLAGGGLIVSGMVLSSLGEEKTGPAKTERRIS